jgi:hypothetical protein
MRAKKTPRTKGSKPSTRGKRRIGLTSAIGPKATTAVVCVVLAGGLWFGSRLSAKTRTATPSVDAQITDVALETPAPAAKTAAATTHDITVAPVRSATVTASNSKAPVTTLQGCLERSGDAFRLKDPSGADAPKARSWKSGFIKKSPAAVDLVDPSESLGLANRVGTRVSVTGTLVDREMMAHAIHRLASSCNAAQP